MRISGGQLKGRKTVTSRKVFSHKRENGDLRPTSSKVREALFDILRYDIDNASFLDLYAGTGTVGFEALSRGAEKVFFVEDNNTRYIAIRDFIGKLGLGEKTFAYKQQAADFLKRTTMSGLCFDVIFVDPPYSSGESDKIFPLIDSGDTLKEGGCLIIEHASKAAMPEGSQTLKLIKNYRYGDTMLTLYRKAK